MTGAPKTTPAGRQRAEPPLDVAPSSPRCLSVTGSVVVGLKLADRQRSPEIAATRAWHGKIATVARAGADKNAEPGIYTGTSRKTRSPSPRGRGQGRHEGVDRRQDALGSGSTTRRRSSLDRATSVTIGDGPRSLTLNDGAILADVAHIDNAPPAKIDTRRGRSASSAPSSRSPPRPIARTSRCCAARWRSARAARTRKVAAGQEARRLGTARSTSRLPTISRSAPRSASSSSPPTTRTSTRPRAASASSARAARARRTRRTMPSASPRTR